MWWNSVHASTESNETQSGKYARGSTRSSSDSEERGSDPESSSKSHGNGTAEEENEDEQGEENEDNDNDHDLETATPYGKYDVRFFISKSINEDVHFDAIDENPTIGRNVLFWDSPYVNKIRHFTDEGLDDCHCVGCFDITMNVPRDIAYCESLTNQKWREIEAQMKAIRVKATQKREKLFWIAIKCPYIPFRWKLHYYCKLFLLGHDRFPVMCDIDLRYFFPRICFNYNLVCCLPTLVPIVLYVLTGLVFVLLLDVILLLGAIIDTLTLRIFCEERMVEREKEWYKRQFNEFPELDTGSIQASIYEEVVSLSKRLHQELEGVDVDVYSQREVVITQNKNKRTYHYFDVIGLVLVDPNRVIDNNDSSSSSSSNNGDNQEEEGEGEEGEGEWEGEGGGEGGGGEGGYDEDDDDDLEEAEFTGVILPSYITSVATQSQSPAGAQYTEAQYVPIEIEAYPAQPQPVSVSKPQEEHYL